jgi:hypothetical protein
MSVGRLLDRGGQSIRVQSVSSVELARGSMAVFALTEGYMGEGRVLVHLVDGSKLELGWDAFAGQASTLAGLVGVSLTDLAADASRRRAAAAQLKDPGRQRRSTILVYVAVAGVLMVVFALLFGALLMSIFQMITRH